MADIIVQPKVLNADGVTYDNLIMQQAVNATYAQYASTDTSKGTIEERLTRLGFKEGVIDLNSIAPVTSTNYVHRQGNYVTGQLAWRTFFSLPSGDTVLGTIPENFRPTYTAEICVFTSDNYNCSIKIGTDGKITVSSSAIAIFGTFTFGYEAPALT